MRTNQNSPLNLDESPWTIKWEQQKWHEILPHIVLACPGQVLTRYWTLTGSKLAPGGSRAYGSPGSALHPALDKTVHACDRHINNPGNTWNKAHKLDISTLNCTHSEHSSWRTLRVPSSGISCQFIIPFPFYLSSLPLLHFSSFSKKNYLLLIREFRDSNHTSVTCYATESFLCPSWEHLGECSESSAKCARKVCRILECDAAWLLREQTFRRNTQSAIQLLVTA
jgi:hypothetical protein